MKKFVCTVCGFVYEGDELKSEYSLTYKSVTVSEEVAKNIKLINAMMATF